MTDGVNVSEQWLLEGDCSVCRRKRYCTKGCKKNRIAKERQINAIITNAIIKRLRTKEEVNE